MRPFATNESVLRVFRETVLDILSYKLLVEHGHSCFWYCARAFFVPNTKLHNLRTVSQQDREQEYHRLIRNPIALFSQDPTDYTAPVLRQILPAVMNPSGNAQLSYSISSIDIDNDL